jgi:hypothetical protein
MPSIGNPEKCRASEERVLLVGTDQRDHIRSRSQNGSIQKPDTWLHPTTRGTSNLPE